MGQKFKGLKIRSWQQFDNVDIELHERLTIITGANGSGKTTLLNILGKHCNWQMQSLAVPKKDAKSGVVEWVIGTFFKKHDVNQLPNQIGEIIYWDDASAQLIKPNQVRGASYELVIGGQQAVKGCFVPSHRPIFRYEKLENIPADFNKLSKRAAFLGISTLTRGRYSGEYSRHSANYQIKETLIAWSAFGEGGASMEPTPRFVEYYHGFEKILKDILPPELEFKRLLIRDLEVLLECETDDFLLDSASGGITALIDMAWQVYMFGEDNASEYTVIIDEVENHLHPTLQRRLLDNLLKAFPKVTFIVSTHSPLVVNSVRDSHVYALQYKDKKVVSLKLDLINQAKTATEILDEVLGVSFTMPIWAEKELDEIMGEFGQTHLSKEDFSELRRRLEAIGLGELVPYAIGVLVEGRT